MRFSPRPKAYRIGWAEKMDGSGSYGHGQVHWSRIHSHHQIGLVHERGQLREAGTASQIHSAGL